VQGFEAGYGDAGPGAQTHRFVAHLTQRRFDMARAFQHDLAGAG
jgi:hypothetical protein